jgi:cytochrome c553
MKSPVLLFALGLASFVAACTTAAVEEETLDTEASVATPREGELAPLNETSLLALKGYSSPIARNADGQPALGAGVVTFTPRYELWSDGAKKRRFIQLPKGEKIAVDEKGIFTFPMGTLIYKEFYKGGKLHETRVIQRAPSGFKIATYLWNAEGTDATLDTDGGTFGDGETEHEVPAQTTCGGCHKDGANPVLGLSYVQLNPKMSAEDKRLLFSAAPRSFEWPEAATESTHSTLGYLHANCGHCHNDTSEGGFSLRLLPSDTKAKDLASLAAFVSTRDTATSMLRRLKSGGMPRLGVSVVDPRVKNEGDVAAGIAAIAAMK